MTGLLVSVRNGEEARAALAGGADLVDVKEPSRGSLGAADEAVWLEVLRAVASKVPTSVALGELCSDAADADIECVAGFDFAKVGLAGCGGSAGWPRDWANLLSRLPRSVTPVAVVYADWRAACAPPPDEIIDHARRLACGAVLFDTFDKSRGDLTVHMGAAELSQLVGAVHDRSMLAVLGGSLGAATIPCVMSFGPDYIAVRGAVCHGTRTGTIDERLVRELAELIDCHNAARLSEKFSS
jgi:uncharacterized protein (UPF0264 family)